MYVLFSFTMAVASGRAGQVYVLDSVYNVGQEIFAVRGIHGYKIANVLDYSRITFLHK